MAPSRRFAVIAAITEKVRIAYAMIHTPRLLLLDDG